MAAWRSCRCRGGVTADGGKGCELRNICHCGYRLSGISGVLATSVAAFTRCLPCADLCRVIALRCCSLRYASLPLLLARAVAAYTAVSAMMTIVDNGISRRRILARAAEPFSFCIWLYMVRPMRFLSRLTRCNLCDTEHRRLLSGRYFSGVCFLLRVAYPG